MDDLFPFSATLVPLVEIWLTLCARSFVCDSSEVYCCGSWADVFLTVICSQHVGEMKYLHLADCGSYHGLFGVVVFNHISKLLYHSWLEEFIIWILLSI